MAGRVSLPEIRSELKYLGISTKTEFLEEFDRIDPGKRILPLLSMTLKEVLEFALGEKIAMLSVADLKNGATALFEEVNENEKTELLKTIPYEAKKKIPGIKHEGDAAYFYTDSKNNFWIGALDGIYLYNTSTDQFKNFSTASSWTMLESSEGELWFGTAFGLGRYDTATREMVLYSHNEEDPYSIPSDNIYKIFER